jgi:hypothetical protein
VLVLNSGLGSFIQLKDTSMLSSRGDAYVGAKGTRITYDFALDAKIFISPIMAGRDRLRPGRLEADPIARISNILKVSKTSMIIESTDVSQFNDFPGFPGGPVTPAALMMPSHIRPAC